MIIDGNVYKILVTQKEAHHLFPVNWCM